VIRPKTTITATSGLVTIFILWSVVGSREKKGRELVKGTDRQRERERERPSAFKDDRTTETWLNTVKGQKENKGTLISC
jgi:hypothetical protein